MFSSALINTHFPALGWRINKPEMPELFNSILKIYVFLSSLIPDINFDKPLNQYIPYATATYLQHGFHHSF